MKTSDFDYELPEELIAQHPLPNRGMSRLLVMSRSCRTPLVHRTFSDLPALLPSGALLVLNDTRVIPARLRGRRPTGGRVELLLVEPEDPKVCPKDATVWRCLYSSSRPLRPGDTILLERNPSIRTVVLARHSRGEITCEFSVEGGLLTHLDDLGEVPLPPYIRRPGGEAPEDRERYQTVYARRDGAVAAPTAGLHFTQEIFQALTSAGIEYRMLTLHVGPGTFSPVKSEDIQAHTMHEERFEIPEETAEAVNRARASSRPVIAVGTTVVRALESASDERGLVMHGSGRTDLFITPGYHFRCIDGLITNFHLPRSTLIMLVAAFVGRERLLAAYHEAIHHRYRFYSYGDAMLVLP